MSPHRSWRLLVHALDRTGPPMLVLAFARWLREQGDDVDVVAFRGGPMAADLAPYAAVTVLLHDEEAWDHHAPDPQRAAELRALLEPLARVDATLLVSTSASQVLPYLPADPGPLVTWSVEMGEDLHWLTGPTGVVARTTRWLAGSETTAAELRAGLGAHTDITVIPEFVDEHPDAELTATEAANLRAGLGAADDVPLAVAAGIGTRRKGIDLFVEVAAAHARRHADRPAHFTWVGGSRDPLWEPSRREAARLGLERCTFLEPVPDLARRLAMADVFVHTARTDAFPLVCLHAAAAGVPVVAFAGAGGVEEMFGSAFRGTPYPDVNGLADLVAQLAAPGIGADVAAAQRAAIAGRNLTSAAAPRLRDALVAAADAAVGA